MAFVAPEILEGEQPTIRTDIYGIGITIIAAILGRSPFINDDPSTPAGLAMQVMKGNAMAVPPGRISPEFEALLLQCMHLDPQQRPSGASMLRHQLAKLPPPIENTVDSDAQNATTVIEMVPQDDAAKKTSNDTAIMEAVPAEGSADQATGSVQAQTATETAARIPPAAEEQRSRLPLLVGLAVILIALGGLVFAVSRNGESNDANTNQTESAERSSGTFEAEEETPTPNGATSDNLPDSTTPENPTSNSTAPDLSLIHI